MWILTVEYRRNTRERTFPWHREAVWGTLEPSHRDVSLSRKVT
jgi:hypothetical protein